MARLGKLSKDGLAIVICATHAVFFWIIASDNSAVTRDYLIGSIVVQTSVTPTAIAGGKFLENSRDAEMDFRGTR